mgnify:FL=1
MEEKKKICSKCKTENEEKAIFCTNCGTSLNKKKKHKKVVLPKIKINKNILIPIITLILGAIIMFGLISLYNPTLISNVTKVEKDVTVTDTGIADAVEKIYDAVVVVENYNNDKLIATGTGFVFQKDNDYGYIITNNHVIENANSIYVTFTNGTREKVTLLGSDTYSDIAVLAIAADKIISVAEIGNSEEARVGDTTFAIGTPLNYEVYSWSVTRGILSGKDRLVEVKLSNNYSNSDYVMKVLQTDTAINSGNSGGPLCNSNGEVIGITNMKLASSSVEGMGFAIPIETAIKYANKYIEGNTIDRPYLGIAMYNVSDLRINTLGIDTKLTDGVYIYSVEENSPAAKAGLQKGDIIVGIDDQKVTNSAYLKYLLYEYNINDEVKIKYYRNNKEYETTVKLLAESSL